VSGCDTADCRDGFRMAMRRLAGGVVILTASEAGVRYGMTMTAVMSLTMDPPALALGINRGASIAAPIARVGRFCVNLLSEDHADFCAEFSRLPTAERFTVGDWLMDAEGRPYLASAQASIFCTAGPSTDFGTHVLLVGIADRVAHADAVAPLVHVDGRYSQLVA
jgi:flavin reductase